MQHYGYTDMHDHTTVPYTNATPYDTWDQGETLGPDRYLPLIYCVVFVWGSILFGCVIFSRKANGYYKNQRDLYLDICKLVCILTVGLALPAVLVYAWVTRHAHVRESDDDDVMQAHLAYARYMKALTDKYAGTAPKHMYVEKLYLRYWDPNVQGNNVCPTCQKDYLHASDAVIGPSCDQGGEYREIVLQHVDQHKVVKPLKFSFSSVERTTQGTGKVSNDLDTCVTPCGHCYHYRCLTQSMERSTMCPICRSEVTLTDCFIVSRAKHSDDIALDVNCL